MVGKHTFDARTPILMSRLGFSYYNDGLYEKALPIYEILRDRHRGDFQRLEPDAFRKGRGGHYDRILSDLAIIYLRQGNSGNAEKVRSELTEFLPQSPDIEKLTPENFMADMSRISPPQWNTRHMLIRGTLVVAGAALILWGLYAKLKGNKA